VFLAFILRVRSNAFFLRNFTRDLLDKVKDAFSEEHPEGIEEACIRIPSLSWLDYQFAPANLGDKVGLRNIGMIQLFFKGIYINEG
jgi:hypothetical protein